MEQGSQRAQDIPVDEIEVEVLSQRPSSLDEILPLDTLLDGPDERVSGVALIRQDDAIDISQSQDPHDTGKSLW